MQKHQERISVVLCRVTTLPLLDYTSVEEKTPKTHTCWVCSSTHTCWWDPYSSCSSSKNKGLHCALGDMTLLEFIATSACVHSSKLHNMDGDEMRHRVNHDCSTGGGGGGSLAAQVKVKLESHWNTITPECAEVIAKVHLKNTRHSLQGNYAAWDFSHFESKGLTGAFCLKNQLSEVITLFNAHHSYLHVSPKPYTLPIKAK